MISFASDNNSGVHPKVLAALEKANSGHAGAYGNDEHTTKAEALLHSVFGEDSRAFFVFLGTAANVLAITGSLKPYEAVVCADSAHIYTDECGAIEAAGRKLYAVPGHDGKIRPQDAEPLLAFADDVHHAWPKMVSITQSTELGTLYRPEEIRALSAFCRANGLYLHMDGSRLANAAAALGLGLREASRDLGVDILSLGGTKNGLMYGEAVLFFNPALAPDFPFYRKQGMQLGSKMRFLSAQFSAYLQNDLWRRNALHANAMTILLAEQIKGLPGIRVTQPVSVNSIFLRIPQTALDKLSQKYKFSIWDLEPDNGGPAAAAPVDGPEIRIMTSFNTTEEQVGQLAADIKKLLS